MRAADGASPELVSDPGRVQSPGRLELRVVELLERMGTPEAKLLLEKVARGTAASQLGRDAQESLDRLSQKGPGR
jgi:hypothetical protein